MISRRGFFQRVLGAAIVAKIAPLLPKALSQPLFTPRYYEVSVPISVDEINAVVRADVLPGLMDAYFRDSPLLAMITRGPVARRTPWQDPYEYRGRPMWDDAARDLDWDEDDEADWEDEA